MSYAEDTTVDLGLIEVIGLPVKGSIGFSPLSIGREVNGSTTWFVLSSII